MARSDDADVAGPPRTASELIATVRYSHMEKKPSHQQDVGHDETMKIGARTSLIP